MGVEFYQAAATLFYVIFHLLGFSLSKITLELSDGKQIPVYEPEAFASTLLNEMKKDIKKIIIEEPGGLNIQNKQIDLPENLLMESPFELQKVKMENSSFLISAGGNVTLNRLFIEIVGGEKGNQATSLFLIGANAILTLKNVIITELKQNPAFILLRNTFLFIYNCSIINQMDNNFKTSHSVFSIDSNESSVYTSIQSLLIKNVKGLILFDSITAPIKYPIIRSLMVDIRLEDSQVSCMVCDLGVAELRIESLVITGCSVEKLIFINFFEGKSPIVFYFRFFVIKQSRTGDKALFAISNINDLFIEGFLLENNAFSKPIFFFQSMDSVTISNISLNNNINGNFMVQNSVLHLKLTDFLLINNTIKDSPLIYFEDIGFLEIRRLIALSNNFFNSSLLKIGSNPSRPEIKALLTNHTIVNNSFHLVEGLILLQMKGVVKVHDSLFRAGVFLSNGVLLKCINEEASLIIELTKFIMHQATASSLSIISFLGEFIFLKSICIHHSFSQSRENLALIIFSGKIFFSNNSEFTFNQGSSSGIFGLIEDLRLPISLVTFYNSSFKKNWGSNSAIALKICKGMHFYFKECTVESNSYDKYGFLFLLFDSRSSNKFIFFFQGSQFLTNSAKDGALFYLSLVKISITWAKCIFYKNKASYYGGVFYLTIERNNSIYLLDSVFQLNSALQSAILHMVVGNIIIVNCTFSNNFANLASTSFIKSYSIVSIFYCIIKGAYSSESYNFILEGSSNLEIYNTHFFNCSSGRKSAGISLFWMAQTQLYGCSFQNISAFKGTIISGNGILSVYFNFCTFINLIVYSGALFEVRFMSLMLFSMTFFASKGTIISSFKATVIISNASIHGSYGYGYEIPHHFIDIFMDSKCLLTDFILFNYSDSRGGAPLNTNKHSELSISSGFTAFLHNAPFIGAKEGILIINNVAGNIYREFLIGTESINIFISHLVIIKVPYQGDNAAHCGILLRSGSIIIAQSILSNFTDSAIKLIQSKLEDNIIYSSKIINSFSYNGAGINIEDSHLLLISVHLDNNQARFRGGGMFFDCEEYRACNWIIKNCTFNKNIAIAGEGIFWTKHPPLMNEEFLAARSGEINFIASSPKFLHADDKLLNNSILNSFTSGTTLEIPLIIYHKDYYNQTANYLNSILVSIRYLDNAEAAYAFETGINSLILGQSNVYTVGGVAVFNALRLISTPNSSRVLIVQSQAIDKVDEEHLFLNEFINKSFQNHLINNKTYRFQLKINFSLCKQGQIYLKNINVCYKCPPGTFSLSPSDNTSCSMCPIGASCPGGFEILLYPGYWRRNMLSSNLVKCKNDLICIGGSSDEICRHGHKGTLCGVCLTRKDHNEPYFRDFDQICKPCYSDDNNRMLVFLSLLILISFAYLILMIKSKLTSHHTIKAALLKILTDYIHFITLLMTVVSRKRTGLGVIRSILNLFDPYNFLIILDCNSDIIPIELNLFFKKLIVVCFLLYSSPLVTLGICLLIKIFMKKSFAQFKKLFLQAFFIFFYLFQPLMIKMLFSAFNCVDVDGKSYISRQMDEECWTSNHKIITALLLIPLLILIMLVLPFFFASHLRARFKEGLSLEIFSYLSNTFRRHLYFWEFILMMQKYFIIISTTLIRDFDVMFIFLILVLFFFLLLNSFFKPYVKLSINKLFISSRLATFLTVLYFYISFQQIPYPLYVLSTILFLTANIYFIFFYLKSYFTSKKSLMLLNKILFFLPKVTFYGDHQLDNKDDPRGHKKPSVLKLGQANLENIIFTPSVASPKFKKKLKFSEKMERISLD